MPAERWKQIEALFAVAQAQPPAKREEFLRRACPDDAELRNEVHSLLNQNVNSFLESAPLPGINALSPGMKLGNFEIVELIGRGGMGEVYRARDTKLKRDVAIKVLPTSVACDPDRIKRFEREALAASTLNHPNIVSVYETGHDNDIYWIASELVDGETLNRVIERGPLVSRKATEIAAQISDGLAAAYLCGIVHRDLKPGNIMITREGRVKILDFGLAKQRVTATDGTATVTEDLTDTGVILGTPSYMCPEQVRREAVDGRSDIFCLGLILHEMLSGKRTFTGDSSVQVMNAILTEDPQELPASVPASLVRIVGHCLEKEPRCRFQCGADLTFALGSIATSQAASAPGQKRPSWPVWVAAGVICLVAAIAAYLWGKHFRPVGIVAGASLRRLTTDDGLTTDAALSSDGKLVAYASDRENASNLDIWVQHIEGGRAIRLTSDPADDYDPAISPDSSQVAFRSNRNGGGIYEVSVFGGDARLLIPKGNRPRFSPDGKMLMYSIGIGDILTPEELFVQRLSGGTPTRIGVGCGVSLFSAVWSPDGSRILFDGLCDGLSDSTNGLFGPVWVATPDGRRIGKLDLQVRVIDQWLDNPSRLLMPFYPVPSEGTSIAELPISADGTKLTGPAEQLTFGTGTEQHASAANGLVALSASSGADHVWGVPVDAGGHATGVPRQSTSGAAGERLSYLSRDGQKLVFIPRRADHHQLYTKDLKTGKEQEIPWEGAFMQYSVLSPDAAQLVFTSNASSSGPSGSIYEVPLSGGFPKKVFGDPKTSYGVWDWSPDGSTVLFFSSGVVEQMDMKSGARTTFLDDPGSDVWQVHFSPDGRWVTLLERSRIYVAPFRKGRVPRSEWIPVTDGLSDDKPHFSSNGKVIFFSSERDGFRCIWAQALRPDMHPAGDPFAVYHFHERRRSLRNIRIVEFDMAVGPNMVLFNQEERTGNIWLLEQAKSSEQ